MFYVHTFLAIMPYLLLAIIIFLATSTKNKLTKTTWPLWSVILILIAIADMVEGTLK